MPNKELSVECLETIFLDAHTNYGWIAEPVTDEILKRAYEIARMGPTSANCQPMRVVFVRSKTAKEKLKPCLDAGNVEKTMAAPATAIVAYDTRFYEYMAKIFSAEARGWYENKGNYTVETAFRNGTLQGAYLIIALRAVGLDCGPMSGFNNQKLDAAFFPDGRFKSNFLINIGHGDPAKLRRRNYRFEFDESCKIE